MVWKKVVRCAPGTSHEAQGMECQDYGDCSVIKDVIIGAVADGAGSAKYSDVGAKLAVDTVLKYLSDYVNKNNVDEETKSRDKKSGNVKCCENQESDLDTSNADLSKKQAKELFTEAVEKARDALKEKADKEGYSINELACTLLAFIATPNTIKAMQIGDGFIVVRSQDLGNSEYKILFKPDKGEFVNETTFITSTNALNEMQIEVLAKPQFICASTDGLEKVAISFSDWSPFPGFFKPLKDYMHETSHPHEESKYLDDFLKSKQLNARTNDDKTLLLCLYQSKKEGSDIESNKQEKSLESEFDDNSNMEEENPKNVSLREQEPNVESNKEQSSSESQTVTDNSNTEDGNPENVSPAEPEQYVESHKEESSPES